VGLVNGLTRTLPVPHEPGETVTFRYLSALQFQEAADAKASAAVRKMREMGGDLLKGIQEARSDIPASIATAFADPLDSYDAAALLRLGIAAWTYAEPPGENPFAQIDPKTAEWAARAIATLGERTEEDRLNASSSFTST